ncbi:MAG: glycosyl hydrolase [Kiritimatiellaeota bacterium]|nr:glycosyl hydrolase [Kiritimatiellota bacterium]
MKKMMLLGMAVVLAQILLLASVASAADVFPLAEFDGIAPRLSDTPFVPDLAWDLAPGHIFDAPENVEIPIRSKRERIAWVVTDFWGEVVDKGVHTPVNGAATLKPAIKGNGYYLLAPGGDTPVSFAVVPPFKPATRDTPFGVMTHFAQYMAPDILPLLGRVGITSIRDEHQWCHLEKEKGVYAFPAKNDAYMVATEAAGMDPLVVMNFANDFYDDGNAPHTPEGCEAFANYGLAILEHYGPQVKWLEVWNEYNGSWCDGPAADDRPRHYAQMLKRVYEKVKAVRPDVKIIGCAAVVIPLPYLEGIFQHGGLQHMDAVVLHPYRGSPEGVDEEIAQVEDLMRQYNNGELKPIWVTETGFYGANDEAGRQKVARHLARQYALLLTRNVEKIHWYLCRDYMEFQTMGLLRADNDPMGRYAAAPAYAAYAALIKQLDGAKFVRRADLGRFTYALLFEASNGPVWVCWATQPATLAFNADGPRAVVDIMGAESVMTPFHGQIRLSLGEDVVYFRGKGEPTATPDLAIAAEIRTPVLGTPWFKTGSSMGASAHATHFGFTLKTRGQTLTLDRDGRATLPVDTSAPNTEFLHYELFNGAALVAKGTIRHETVESLVFLPQTIMAENATTLFAQLENTLPDAPTYTWRGVDMELSGGLLSSVGSIRRTRLNLRPGNILPMRFEGLNTPLEPYRQYDLELTAKFENRADVTWRGKVAYNPCVKLSSLLSPEDGAEEEDGAWPNMMLAFPGDEAVELEDDMERIRADNSAWDKIPAIDIVAQGQGWGAPTVQKATVKVACTDEALWLRVHTQDTLHAEGWDTMMRFGIATHDNSVWRVLSVNSGGHGFYRPHLEAGSGKWESPMSGPHAVMECGEGNGSELLYLPWETLGMPCTTRAMRPRSPSATTAWSNPNSHGPAFSGCPRLASRLCAALRTRSAGVGAGAPHSW